MNKHIQQAAIQAGLYADLNGEPWPAWLGAESCNQAYEQFALNIINQCISIVEQAAEQDPALYGVALELQDYWDL